MSNEAPFLDITLLGKEYRVACPPTEHQALLKAVAYVDAKMHEIAKKTKSNLTERIAVMAALNIAHEHLSQNMEKDSADQKKTEAEIELETELDFAAAKRRISEMEAQLEAVLQPQEALF
jgi:cell division protein ZapA